MSYRLLTAFQGLFKGKAYLHRASNLGDYVAMHFFEDVYDLRRSAKLVARVDNGDSVVSTQNKRQGVSARRGDGSFGEIVPQAMPISDPGYAVKRGPIATIEIGIEVKILMKAMIKQIDRVGTVLRGQSAHFRSSGGRAILIGIVGINHAPHCTSYEGDRTYRTDGGRNKHPIAEAAQARRRLEIDAKPAFDEFLFLNFSATNEAPFEFKWMDEQTTAMDYGAALARTSQRYEALI